MAGDGVQAPEAGLIGEATTVLGGRAALGVVRAPSKVPAGASGETRTEPFAGASIIPASAPAVTAPIRPHGCAASTGRHCGRRPPGGRGSSRRDGGGYFEKTGVCMLAALGTFHAWNGPKVNARRNRRMMDDRSRVTGLKQGPGRSARVERCPAGPVRHRRSAGPWRRSGRRRAPAPRRRCRRALHAAPSPSSSPRWRAARRRP